MSGVVLGNRERGRTTNQPLGSFRQVVSGGLVVSCGGSFLCKFFVNSYDIPHRFKNYDFGVVEKGSVAAFSRHTVEEGQPEPGCARPNWHQTPGANRTSARRFPVQQKLCQLNKWLWY